MNSILLHAIISNYIYVYVYYSDVYIRMIIMRYISQRASDTIKQCLEFELKIKIYCLAYIPTEFNKVRTQWRPKN